MKLNPNIPMKSARMTISSGRRRPQRVGYALPQLATSAPAGLALRTSAVCNWLMSIISRAAIVGTKLTALMKNAVSTPGRRDHARRRSPGRQAGPR